MNQTQVNVETAPHRSSHFGAPVERRVRAGDRSIIPILGAALLILWGGIAWRIEGALRGSEARGVREATNLARAFEENVLRTLSNIDQTILYLRQNYERSQGAGFDATAELVLAQSMHALALQLAIVNEDGLVTHGSHGRAGRSVDVSALEPFLVHKGRDVDQLDISRPMVDPVSEREAILFTRRLLARQGGFGGILMISVDPSMLSDYHRTVDLGASGSIAVIGRDGYLRAGSRVDAPALASSPLNTLLFDHLAESATGYFIEESFGVRGRRVVAYRAVTDYPLIVTVALEARDWGAVLWEDAHTDVLAGFLLSLLLTAAGFAYRARVAAQARSESGLAAKRDLLRTAIEIFPQGVAFVDARGALRFANRAWLTLGGAAIGLTDDGATNLLDHGPLRALRGQVRNAVLEVVGGRLEDASLDVAVGLLRPGARHHLAIVPLPGEERGALLLLHDVTASRAKDAEVRNLTARLDFFVRSMSEWAWEMGEDFRFVWVSDVFGAATGRDPSDFLGRSLEALVDEAKPEALIRLREDFRAHRAIESFKFSVRGSQGAERILVLDAAPLHDSDGRFLGYRGLVRDRTEAHRFANERQIFRSRLEEAVARERALLETPGNAAVVLEGSGILVACGAAFGALIGQAPDVVVGRHLADCCPEDHAEEVSNHLAELWQAPGSFPMSLRRPDGRTCEVSVSGHRVAIADAAYLYLVVQDRTALIAAEAERADLQIRFDNERNELQRQFEVKWGDLQSRCDAERADLQIQFDVERCDLQSRFDAERADLQSRFKAEHADLQSQVDAERAAIRDFLRMVGSDIHNYGYRLIDLAHRAQAPEDRGEGLGAIKALEKTARRLLAISADVIDAAHLSKPLSVPAVERFDLEGVIGEATALVGDMAAAKGVELVVRIAPDVPRHLAGDARRLGRLLLNALGQAVERTETGEILLGVERAVEGEGAAHLRFAIDVAGNAFTFGVAHGEANALAAIGAWTIPQVGPDAGIGAALLPILVRLMGGELGTETGHEGRDTLWVTVPLEPVKGKEPAAPTSLSGQRMLIIDDSAATREVLAVMLADLGVKSDRAASGKEALEAITAAWAADRPYAVVFIDQGLRDVDSFEAIQRIREQYGAGTFPNLVILADGHMPESAMPHLGKPILRHRLHELLAQILGLAAAVPKTSASIRQADANDPSFLRGTRVLLVDDSPTDQVVARDMLEAVGMNVDVADNGATAFDLARDGDYEIVFMDMRMPIQSGIEATRRLRAIDRLARLPIIALATEDWREKQDALIALGLNDVVIKPIDPDRLYDVIRKWVVGAEARFSRLH
jgi:PAS domain S-box-containing protein